ncbi:MAG: hypothetical protein IJS60_08095 [Abditibacteriota bacterium]|nr:hypothetical protein [Abditibacteriota bacterium]
MTSNERFKKVLNFQKPDRMPVIEWAPWWHLTIDRWHKEGMPAEIYTAYDVSKYFGLDPVDCFYMDVSFNLPAPKEVGGGLIETEEDYNNLKKECDIFGPIPQNLIDVCKKHQEEDGAAVWLWHSGFFWAPRALLGIEPHLYAFYDDPDLLWKINEDCLKGLYRRVDSITGDLDIAFIVLGDDMSYNHGPMLSEKVFKEQLAPFYKQASDFIKSKGIKVIIDSDGLVDEPIRWYREAGCQGFLPLEKQAGVDLNKYRQWYPDYLFVGGFDKLCMDKGESAMRQEFERLLPVMKQGGYILGVDHQTPPNVSIYDYRLYVELFREYAEKAVD